MGRLSKVCAQAEAGLMPADKRKNCAFGSEGLLVDCAVTA